MPRKGDEIWHFLLPDPGMADYADKDAKKLYADDFERLKKWRRAFNAPLSNTLAHTVNTVSGKQAASAKSRLDGFGKTEPACAMAYSE